MSRTGFDKIRQHSVIVNGGSGTLVKSITPELSYILTAKHVITDARGAGQEIEIRTIDGLSFNPNESDIFLHSVENIDLALIRIRIQSDVTLICCNSIKCTRDVHISGYPNDRRNQDENIETFHRKLEGSVCDIQDLAKFVVFAPEFPDYGQAQGLSGGGVYKLLANGDVILCGIEFSMEGTEFNGKLLCHDLSRVNEIISANNLAQIVFTSTPQIEIFSFDWFQQEVKQKISDLGVRYHSELHLDLEIDQVFDFLQKNRISRNRISKEFNTLLECFEILERELCHLESSDERYLDSCVTLEYIRQIYQKYNDNLFNISDLNTLINKTVGLLGKYDSRRNDEYKKYFQSAIDRISSFQEFINSKKISAFNSQIVLISGEAGIGKSHLLGHIAEKNIGANVPCILLLGQHFRSQDTVWTQILQSLSISEINETNLLEVLNQDAESRGECFLFMIDAINEGNGYVIWRDQLSGFITKIKDYPYLSLILTVRESYKDAFLENINISVKNYITIVSHTGFKAKEFEAMLKFFDYYNLGSLRFPFLSAEFSNPLFLRIFCESFIEQEGFDDNINIGIVFNNYIEHINNKVSEPDRLNYSRSKKYVQKCLDAMVGHEITKKDSYIPYDEADIVIKSKISDVVNKNEFIDAFISEGILSKNLNSYRKEEFVYISYERVQDYLKSKHLIRSHNDIGELVESFQNDGELYEYIDEYGVNQGVIEAFFCEVPECFDVEFFDVIPEHIKNKDHIIEAFIDSLAWRVPITIDSEQTHRILSKYILPNEKLFHYFIEGVYKFGSISSHPFNVLILHRYLKEMPLADLDASWTVFLAYCEPEESNLHRLIGYIFDPNLNAQISEESAYLTGILLSWILSTTTKKFRLRATEALVLLLENRLGVALQLLKLFKDCVDPYIHERLYASIYGATLRSKNYFGLNELTSHLITDFFNLEQEVYPNILVRDYARNIIEYAVFKEIIEISETDFVKIRPPYNATFPSSLPSNEETDDLKFDYNTKEFKEYYWSQNTILSSMVTEYGRGISRYGDFGRYVFQSNLYSWENLEENLLSNYACSLIFNKFGYDVEKHGIFDRSIRSDSRHSSDVERIGKKYQWISMYEVLARVADNYKMRDPKAGFDSKKLVYYQGPWEPSVRDIDPSYIHFEASKALQDQFSTLDIEFIDWSGTNDEWSVSKENVPDPLDMIQTKYENEDWLYLEQDPSWREPKSEENNNDPHKELWFQLKSYFVRKDDASKIIEHLKDKRFMGRHMPEARDCYNIFSREYYWSPAYEFKKDPHYGDLGWQDIRIEEGNGNEQVFPTIERTTWESSGEAQEGYRCSMPCNWLFNDLMMKHSIYEGVFEDDSGKIICFDPSLICKSSTKVLINKESLVKFLEKNNLTIIWTLLSEKRAVGLSNNSPEKWLEFSGVYTFSESGELTGTLNDFVQPDHNKILSANEPRPVSNTPEDLLSFFKNFEMQNEDSLDT